MSPLGVVTLFDIDEETGFLLPGRTKSNQIQYKWAHIIAQLLGFGESAYKINAMYLEFENVASPGDAVATPSFDRSEQADYYAGLSGSRDFLRVPILGQPDLAVAPGYEDYFSDGEGNRLTWFAQSVGSSGFRGLPFGYGNNSKVFGVALVSAPVWTDQARDIVFGRTYYDADNQISKQAGRQVGVSWQQTFPTPD